MLKPMSRWREHCRANGTADNCHHSRPRPPPEEERSSESARHALASRFGNKGFRIKDVWLQTVEAGRLEAARGDLSNKQDRRAITMEGVDTETRGGRQRLPVLYPSSPARVFWDLLGAALICYDVLAIPLMLAFEAASAAQADGPPFLEWVPLVYWTADVIASFFVGYVKDGVTHMDPRAIAVRYTKTWLAVDLVVLIPDWGFTLASIGKSSSTGGMSVKLLRIVRLFRMVRLLRLLKFWKIVRSLDGLIYSEYVNILANIAKMIALLLVINHYISCAWYMVGTVGSGETSASWVREYGFEDGDWRYTFSTAFHWGITQFTPASMSVQPQNLQERTFAIAVVIFALVGFSYVVGSITGSLARLRGMQETTSRQFWTLRCFLRQNRVSIALAARVHRYLEHVWKAQHERLSAEQIPIFSSLSDQLRSELQYEIYVPQLSVHPLFGHLRTESSLTLCRLANTAITRQVFARNDTVFVAGEHATHMSFVRTGRLEYSMMGTGGEQHVEWVHKTEDWIAEPVLWMSAWANRGRLAATMECELLLVDPVKFSDTICLNPAAFQIVSTYAQNFARWATSGEALTLSDIAQGDEVGARVRSMMGLDYRRKNSQDASWAPGSWRPSILGRRDSPSRSSSWSSSVSFTEPRIFPA